MDNLGVTEGTRAGTGGAGNIVYGNSINLRGLSPFATLTLLDSHRVPPAGTTGATVDPDSFPSIMIQRVDVVADGASATYGSDAVAGVVNLILRRNVEGFEAQGALRYCQSLRGEPAERGLGHSRAGPLGYRAAQPGLRAELSLGPERPGSRPSSNPIRPARAATNYDSLQCNPGTIRSARPPMPSRREGVTPATAASLMPGTANHCDPFKYQDILPRVRHDRIVAFTFDQTFGDRVSVFARRHLCEADLPFSSAAPTGPAEVPASNAFFVAPPGTSLTSETVNYTFAQRSRPVQRRHRELRSTSRARSACRSSLGTTGRSRSTARPGVTATMCTIRPTLRCIGNLAAALASGNPRRRSTCIGGANPPA